MNRQLLETKEKVKEVLESLPKEKIEQALDYLQYLKDRQEWEATIEIARDKKLMESIRKGKRDIKEGKWVSWEDIKRNV
ncbi:MAG: hypothetical protein AB1633_00765 [Elusimicrobiota bacterium]